MSPRLLGPCKHKQPGLPEARTVEGLHQGNKVFSSEVDEKGHPLPVFAEERRKAYEAKVGDRHKPAARAGKGQAKNVPLYSVWI